MNPTKLRDSFLMLVNANCELMLFACVAARTCWCAGSWRDISIRS
jgi:hypothetical protein